MAINAESAMDEEVGNDVSAGPAFAKCSKREARIGFSTEFPCPVVDRLRFFPTSSRTNARTVSIRQHYAILLISGEFKGRHSRHHPGRLRSCVTSAQIRAARSFIRRSAEDLAARPSLSVATIRRAELTDSETSMTAANDLAVRRAGSRGRRAH